MVKNTLRLKLIRDMKKSAMQFVAVILLCALGTWIFSGLDAAWRMLELSSETYFEEQNLADFWVQLPNADLDAVRKLKNLPGVTAAQARSTLEMTTTLPSEATAVVHGYDGRADINAPLVMEGTALSETDGRGCLLEQQFALANHLSVGDSITFEYESFSQSFLIRGLVVSPEHVITTQDVTPDPLVYGFAIVNDDALSPIPWNEIILTAAPDADKDGLKERMEKLYPNALVLDQKAHGSTLSVRNDVTMFRNLSYVFPLLAFAVAAMIVLTTITRMVENQRIQMGTLKALGYQNGPITRHYLCYALYPSIIGALLGLVVGRVSLPYILWNMEAAQLVLPWQLQAPVSLAAWLVCALAVVLSLLVCFIAYRKSAREVTASLLRPKPPKAGSRVLLERFPSLWRRFGFNTKMVIRNLFRNKSRTLMSLVGVLCCNMLIITSLGLQDSVKYFVGNYYHGTVRYDLRADLTKDAGELDAYQKRLSAGRVEGLMEKAISLRSGDASRTTTLSVLPDNQQVYSLGKNETYTDLPITGVGVTEKLMTVMGLSLGDRVDIWLPGETEPVSLAITKTLYTNIGQGVYMAKSQWDRLHKGAFTPTSLLIQDPGPGCEHDLLEMDELDSLKYPAQQYRQTLTILNSMTGVFTLMAGAALGLAFVICYNMGLLNFMERGREYATLKVLGYHQKEIKKLMVRENNWIAGLGAALGVLPGVWLTGVVMHSAESEQMVFAYTVSIQSILIGCAVTFAFSYLIQRLLTRKVSGLDMVSSLKSVE